MSWSLNNEGRLAQYLLGLMPEDEQRALEDEFLASDALNEEVQAAERDMIDRYLDGGLSAEERRRFEMFFLASPQHKEKLQFARALQRYGAGRDAGSSRSAVATGRGSIPFWRYVASPYARAAALAILLIAAGLVIWRVAFVPAPEQEAMAALAKAYRTGRPFEARISGLEYAPMAQSRGNGAERLDRVNLREAELIAAKQVDNHPGRDSFHTLGRVYLAEQKFDEAIESLRKAAESGPADARLESDLGAALLEHGRQNPIVEKHGEEMAQSRDHLDKALQLDPSLLEARFNRALWYEYVHVPESAIDEWKAYLNLDPNSRWADEARHRLSLLEEQNGRSSVNQERDFDEFVAAGAVGDASPVRDGSTAWKMLSRNRRRGGNAITERLIDEYLKLAEQRGASQAADRLRLISFAGKLDLESAGDSFTSDLAAYYLKATESERKLLTSARRLVSSAYNFYDKTEYERAVQLYQEAGQTFSQAGDRCEAAAAESWAGACWLRIPDTTRALAIFERLAALGSRAGYRALLAESLTSIADAQASRREFSKSLESAARSLEICQSIQDSSGALWSLQIPVVVSLEFEEYYKSIGYAVHGLDLAASFSPEPRETWPFYQLIAADFNALGSPATALQFEESAMRLAGESGRAILKSRSYALLALIHQKIHNDREALQNAESALAEAQAIEGDKSRTNLIANSTLNLAHLYRESGAFDRAVTLYDQAIRLHEQMNLQTYVIEAHRGKLESLIGLGNEQAVAEETKTSISLLEQDRPRILEDSNRSAYFESAQTIYDLAIDFAYSHLHDSREAFGYCEASHARSLLDLISGGADLVAGREGSEVRANSVARPLTLAQIQSRMPETAQILQYAVLPDKVIAWVISRDAAESASMRADRRAYRAGQRFRRSRPGAGQFRGRNQPGEVAL